MQTVFISANDTGSGKTYVTAALACHLLKRGHSVQVVKVIETGVNAMTAIAQTDMGVVTAFAHKHATTHLSALSTRTLLHFAKPLAPVDAAQAEGYPLSFDILAAAFSALPQTADWLLVEGAGGLAVPLETLGSNWQNNNDNSLHTGTGIAHASAAPPTRHHTDPHAETHYPHATPRDWADFALTIRADATLLVVADRLGAINQARLLAAYAQARQLPNCGLWLNAADANTDAEVRLSNASSLAANAAALPLWAIHNHGELWPQHTNAPWLN